MSLIAQAAVSNTASSFDMLFSYAVPDKMAGKIKCGCRILLPFGRNNQKRIAVVMELCEGDSSGLKAVTELIDTEPVVSQELLKLACYIRENTFCTYYEAVKAMLPPGMSISVKAQYELYSDFDSSAELSEEALKLYETLRAAKTAAQLCKLAENASDNGKKALLDELCQKGALKAADNMKQAVGDAAVKMIRLSERYLSEPEKFRLTPKQKKAADFLEEYSTASVRELCYMCGVTSSVADRLVLSGAAEEYECEVLRNVETGNTQWRNPDEIVLSDEQNNAYVRITEKLDKHEPSVFLLHGVTGSGKTSVFEKLIADVIAKGRQAMLLIPEIGLTPQLLGRFRGLFGERVAVIHSGLSLGQRYDEYKRIKRGDADIVIGTRSAVFAPLDNIGIIIMDEEGERSYKSDSAPRYSTCDVAKQRCGHHKSVLLLASATPSVESRYLAEKGVYTLLEMKSRYHGNILPAVEIVDMNLERCDGNKSEFSRKLIDEINLNLQRGEQTILLLNRRGYHTIISCCDCSSPIYCPNCSVPLTYHKANGHTMCHYCGYSCEPPKICPECGSERLKNMGFGTQKLEEELEMYFPTARVLRMDADTTFSRYSYEKSFTAFRNGEYDIMIGTQMIGKGLDFPNVSLVGVLSVDKSLYAGDFRSYERTFSLITQVVGRGGRGDVQGRALLQTFMPEHYVMNLAAEQDYESFYREEIAIRRAMIYPPVCDMCILCFAGEEDCRVQKGTEAVLELMNEKLRALQPKTPVRVLGPVKCSYGKINGKYRYRIIMKCKNNAEMRMFIRELLTDGARLREMNKITFYADINGDVGV